jgi:hypothetical protein
LLAAVAAVLAAQVAAVRVDYLDLRHNLWLRTITQSQSAAAVQSALLVLILV